MSLPRRMTRPRPDVRPDVRPNGPRLPAAERFATLPAPVAMSDTVESIDPDAAPDPEGGRDTDTEFVIRHVG